MPYPKREYATFTKEAFLAFAVIRQRCMEKLKREHPEMGLLDRKDEAQRIMHAELAEALFQYGAANRHENHESLVAEAVAQLAQFNAWRDMGYPVPE